MPSHHDLDEFPAQLWRMVAVAPHRLLMLDYDGTLAPFAVARSEARPTPRSLELLRRIAASRHTSVAIVSGRPLDEVEALLGEVPGFFVGEHGWESRAPNGDLVRWPVERPVAAAIDAAEALARDAGWGTLLERKRSAVVLHTRGQAKARAREIEAACMSAWGPIAAGGLVALDAINGGVELRARSRNKGTVVLSLLAQSAPGTLGVFVGDDATDEDAFEAVLDRGFGVRVGDASRPTVAQAWLPSCDAVPSFLEEWLRIEDATGEPGT